ncbi:hypothetical protein CPT03_07640 [Pedobacter ginsengisoli]|uniref:Uncharacterized protein n=1 Tax=Pedobacter ginsengisoli TaxID=363852 RepID=A0A2D1U417_9SPHI|nr:hypothetical protein CPT03_07640 [Pedobacter ginsengisoli]
MLIMVLFRIILHNKIITNGFASFKRYFSLFSMLFSISLVKLKLFLWLGYLNITEILNYLQTQSL